MFNMWLKILILILTPISIFGQGTIFGVVTNSDMSTPANGEIRFLGYLNDTDEEIRIETSFGAGYDAGNWYDDFQNYLSEAQGNPYDFHFFNIINNETFILSDTMPDNSFQQENVQLAINSFPLPPSGFSGKPLADSSVKLSWDYNPNYTYRLYRRHNSSDGSFFRIDNPSGSLADFGVNDSVLFDTTTDNISEYDYLIIPLDNGQPGLHSDFITVISGTYICGDVDRNGSINVLDLTYLIGYLYLEGDPPDPPESGDVDNSGLHNVLDLTYLIRYLYMDGEAPICPESI